MKPLHGLFVLDLTRHLPGPWCTTLLADFGADVVKVEALDGDPVRVMPPFVSENGADVSVAFRTLNAGKRSIAIDLKTSEGRKLFLDLVAHADAVVEGFRPGVLDRLGVGEAACREKNPRLVWASVTGFGETGPYRDRAGHDITYQALAGSLHGAGDPQGTSVGPPVQVADMTGALSAFGGLVLALLARERTQKGQRVSTSLFQGALAVQPFQLVPPARGERAISAETLSGTVPCYRVYRTKDGRSVALGALEPKFWDTFCELVGRSEWEGRGHDPELMPEVARLFAEKTFDEWRLLENAECCLAGVLAPDEVAHDPQVEALGALVRGADGKPSRLAPPMTLAGVETQETRAPARTGEHTEQVLKERLGLDADAIRALRERGVIA